MACAADLSPRPCGRAAVGLSAMYVVAGIATRVMGERAALLSEKERRLVVGGCNTDVQGSFCLSNRA